MKAEHLTENGWKMRKTKYYYEEAAKRYAHISKGHLYNDMYNFLFIYDFDLDLENLYCNNHTRLSSILPMLWLNDFRSFLVTYNYQVNETAFFKLKKFFEYEDISTLPLEECVIENHFTRLDLDLVFESTPLSERLIERLHCRVSLDHVLSYQVVGTKFLQDHAHEFTEKEWGIIAKRQKLSPFFMVRYLHHLDFNELVEKQKLTLSVYEQAEKLGICIDWDNVVMCQNIDMDVMEKYWDKWDKIVQNLVIEHQQLNLAQIEFVIPKISRNQCAILLTQQICLTTPSITKIIVDYFSKWIYSKNYTAINILLETVAYRIDWTKLIYSNFCNHGFIYDEKIKNKILAEIERRGSNLIENYKPAMAKKAMRKKMLLEAKTHCCMSDFIYIDIL